MLEIKDLRFFFMFKRRAGFRYIKKDKFILRG
jgi:hypothetical protein